MTNGVRTAAAVAVTALALSVLGSCGGQSPYCAEVEQNTPVLDTFLAKRTDAAFAGYARAATAISKVAPSSSDRQWSALAAATREVVAAHRDVGLAVQDLKDKDARAALSTADVTKLNGAYDTFNATRDERKAVVADVKKTCDIPLK